MYAYWGQLIHSQKKEIVNYREQCQDEKTGMNW